MPVDSRITVRSATIAAAAVVYLLILTILLVLPSPLWLFGWAGADFEETVDRSISDLIQHVLAYTNLTVLILAAIETKLHRALITGAVFCLLHALATEFLQYVIPNRYLDGRDMAANAIGVLIGVVLVLLASRIKVDLDNTIQEGRNA